MLTQDDSLSARCDVTYKPLPGWSVTFDATTAQYRYGFAGQPIGTLLGDKFGYPRQAPETFGLHRTALMAPKLRFDPAAWTEDFRLWPELMYPTAYAESDADFLVVNCWDKAAITVGFLQLAAHTEDDMIPLFRRLLADVPDEMKQWFPELGLIGGKVCFVKDNRYKSLEEPRQPTDGIAMANWARGDFMQFFNPDRKSVDQEELHASARWVEWSMRSAASRKVQIAESIQVMKKKAVDVLHRALLQHASDMYPHGVDRMRCDHLGAALAVPHWSSAAVDKAVYALTRTGDIIDAFEHLQYGPGDRAKDVIIGVRERGTRLSSVRYDYAAGEPVASHMPA